MKYERAALLTLMFSIFWPVASASAQGAVHVVDAAGGPGSEFTTFFDALAAANDGDLLLVRSGTYEERPVIDGKALVIVADTGAQVNVQGLDVANTDAGEVVLVRGLRMLVSAPTSILGGRAAEVELCQGPVWFESCNLDATSIFLYGHSGSLLVQASRSVVLADCRVARPFGSASLPTLSTLEARAGSRVHVLGCELSGMPARAVIELSGSRLELSRSSVTGADGQDCFISTCCQAGGDGLALEAGALATLRDIQIQPGQGGLPDCADGQDVLPLGGFASTIPGGSQRLEVEGPVREGETVHVTLHGAPGDRVWIRFALAPAAGTSAPFLDGELLLSAWTSVPAGLVPPSGSLQLSGPAPVLAPGVEGQAFYLQAVVRSASGRFQTSVPSTLIVLDAAL